MLTIRVRAMKAILPGRVTAMLPVLAVREVVQPVEISRLPMEPCVTDTCPARVKGYLLPGRAVWRMWPALVRERIKKVLAARAAITARLMPRAVKKVCIEIFYPRYFLSGVFY